MAAEKKSTGHLPMLDSLRLIAAVWVAMSHGARLPLWDLLDPAATAGKVLIAVNNGLFNGIAAVMIFFVISGLVIHLPCMAKESVPLGEFYARRLIRIVGPALVAYVIFRSLGPRYLAALEDVLWSIYCEIIYYLAYPAVHRLARRFSMSVLLATSTLAAAAVLVVSHPALYYWQLPLPLMALAGFPCWLLGCKLAELFRDAGWADMAIGRRDIWIWRMAALVLQAVLKFPITHGPLLVGAPESHWMFAVFSVFWLAREISYAKIHAPAVWLEKAGACTYSLYLVHHPVLHAFQTAGWRAPSWVTWLAQGACLIAGTYLFYKTVEQPFHGLARRAASWRWGAMQRRLSGLFGFSSPVTHRDGHSSDRKVDRVNYRL